MNESRPGVTSSVLKPQQAVAYLAEVVAKRPEIAVMGIAGPGDPFANPEETMETLRLTRERFPKMMLCLASNGLGIGPYIEELATMNVSHVTITITAVDPKIGAKIYAWIRDGKQPLRGEEAAALLLERQIAAVRELKARNIVVKINSIIIPGINDEHIPEIAKVVGRDGRGYHELHAARPGGRRDVRGIARAGRSDDGPRAAAIGTASAADDPLRAMPRRRGRIDQRKDDHYANGNLEPISRAAPSTRARPGLMLPWPRAKARS